MSSEAAADIAGAQPQTGNVLLRVEGGVARLTLSRPEARNALTAAMYDRLAALARELGADDDVRAIVLVGEGGHFAAGADIVEFTEFTSGADGIDYEARQQRHLDALADVPKPVVAAVDGYAVGGGMSIASTADIRICTSEARFGYPTARTLGNCLSVQGYAGLVWAVGASRARDMLVRARLMGAEEALVAGYVAEVVDAGELMSRADEIARAVARNAPLSIHAAKESLRRIRDSSLPDTDDLVERVYGSAEFREGVRAFRAKERPAWRR